MDGQTDKQIGRCMDRNTEEQTNRQKMDGCTDGQMDGCADGQMNGWTDGQMDVCTNGQMDGCADGRMDRWTDGQMDRQTQEDGQRERHKILFIGIFFKLDLPGEKTRDLYSIHFLSKKFLPLYR